MIIIKNNQNSVNLLNNKIEKNSNMVIIGDGGTNKFHKEILYFDNYKDVESLFGNSSLTNAYKTAKQFGCNDIFLINSLTPYDYIDISNMILQYDFAYIVPININLTDYFINPHSNNKEYYIEYMLSQVTDYNNSVIITTDKHAALFDDIDSYLLNIETNSDKIKTRLKKKHLNAKDLIYVTNNLADYDFANVVLASALCSSRLNEYPTSSFFGKCIFDIDYLDTQYADFVYFQNNLNNTSIEHLFNLSNKLILEKDVMVDRIVRYIKRNLTFDEYTGTFYSGQQLISIKNKITYFMNFLVNTVLKKYYIKNVHFVKERTFVGNIIIELEIIPINHVEAITVVIKS